MKILRTQKLKSFKSKKQNNFAYLPKLLGGLTPTPDIHFFLISLKMREP